MTECPVVDITMKDGRVFERVAVDGGGTEMTGPNAGRREVHGSYHENPGHGVAAGQTFFCEFEDEISVARDSASGETVQIGFTV